MKIAELSTRFPPAPGGVERHVGALARELGARGHRVRVLTSDLETEFPWRRFPPTVPRVEATAFGGIERLSVWSLPGELHYPFFRGLGAALARERPDVVHVHTFGTHQVTVARRHHRRYGTPYVLTAHFHPITSIYGGWTRHRLRGFYDRFLARGAVRHAARIVVQTREEERLLRSVVPELPPVVRIPPGPTEAEPLPAGAPSFATRFGVSGPFVLFVGRLAPNKGLSVLADAFAALRAAAPDAELVVIGGDGGAGSAFERRLTERGVRSAAHLLGHIPDDRYVAAAEREARILVLPSEYEAFGLVLLDALAHGTPVVASRVGGIPELVEDGRAGLLVPPNDAAALADALKRLWPDEERRRAFGRYGQMVVAPRYSWAKLAERLDAVFSEVVGR